MRCALHAHPLVLDLLGLDKPIDWPKDISYPYGVEVSDVEAVLESDIHTTIPSTVEVS